jgi:hypothetical protein
MKYLLFAVLAACLTAPTAIKAAGASPLVDDCKNQEICWRLFDSPYPAAYAGMKQNADIYERSSNEYSKIRWLHEYALATVTLKADASYSCYITTAADYELPCAGIVDDAASFFANE